jgi:hypothetical protein
MLPPPGFEPALTSVLEDVTTSLSSVIASATSVDMASTTSSILAAVASATATAIAETNKNEGHKNGPHDGENQGECELLGPFAILVQGALGCMALLALVYKRWRERPQRPMKVWFFDVSKQVVGSVLVHIANLLMSMLSSGQFSIKVDTAVVSQRARRMVDENGKYQPNPCSFYLLNLAIDVSTDDIFCSFLYLLIALQTTVGIPILIFLLRIFTALFARTPFGNPRESIESGHYGSPPKATWWAKQSLIYFLGLMGMKICVLIIFLALPWISRIGDWALRWTEGDEALQVIFVMLIFPVIMNATQYYIIDSFIKKQSIEHAHERIPDGEDGDSVHGDAPYEDPRSGSSDEVNSDEDDAEVLAKAKADKERKSRGGGSGQSRGGPRSLQTGSKDYDPMFDGETSPTVVGSASTSDRTKLLGGDGDSVKK